MEILPGTEEHVFPQPAKLSGKTETYNVLLKLNGKYNPIASVCGVKLPVEYSEHQKRLAAAHAVLKNFDIKLEPVEDIDGLIAEFLDE